MLGNAHFPRLVVILALMIELLQPQLELFLDFTG